MLASPMKARSASEPTAPAGEAPEAPRAEEAAVETCVTASHHALFAADATRRCDACGEPLRDESDDGFAIEGAGLYVWARGDDVRYEEAPLCASCASAIGLTALTRWEIEEEEG
jgi:hypothetical protein